MMLTKVTSDYGYTSIRIGQEVTIIMQTRNKSYMFDVRGSVHYSIIHLENPTRCNSVSKFINI